MILATIEKVKNLRPHPNADKLEICDVLGFQCVVPIGLHNEGDIIIYIQTDTVLPAGQEWAEEYIQYSPKRVKAVKLRGVFSEGIVAPLSKWDDHKELFFDERFPEDCVGDEVSEIIGVTKYEPPLPSNESAIGTLPYQMSKTDETRFENMRDLPLGEIADVGLKIDGQSCVSENTIILTEDGEMTIKVICDNKYFGSVLSYDDIEEKEVYKKILNHSIRENDDNWYEIVDEFDNILIVTGEHKIYLPEFDYYRRVDELNGDEKLLIL